MKKLIIILLFITTSLHAEKIERLGFYNIQEILGDDKLTYKIIKGCVSMNSAVTEIIKEEYPNLAKEFFETANYLYPFGILVLKKIKNTNHQEAEKEYYFSIDNLTNDYIKSLNVPSVDTIIGNRQIYASSMGEGKTAIEKQRKGSAVDEIKKLSSQILSELN